jgi:Uncharacterized protein conserved in bacteria (DUF2330).
MKRHKKYTGSPSLANQYIFINDCYSASVLSLRPEHILQIMQLRSATSATIMSAKKNAKTIVMMMENASIATNLNDNAMSAAIIVPIVPANKQVPFLHKHFVKALEGVTAPKNKPSVKRISVNTPNPNAIQVETTMNGIRSSANSVPIIAANTILMTIPKQLQALQPHFF